MDTASHVNPPVRIGLLDFEPLRIAGLREIFAARPDLEVVATDLSGVMGKTSFDLIVFAVREESFALSLLGRIRARLPGQRVILLGSGSEEALIIEAIAAGAKGWLEDTASPEQILQAVDVVQSGSIWAPRRVLSRFVDRALGEPGPRVRGLHPRLTEREEQVLRQLVLARSNREIAAALSIREQTVKSYVARLMRKVGVGNRIALSMEAASGEWWGTRET
jgi:DNA-binding NarL/FixJ family response regulator